MVLHTNMSSRENQIYKLVLPIMERDVYVLGAAPSLEIKLCITIVDARLLCMDSVLGK
jgi:hypothetical protein